MPIVLYRIDDRLIHGQVVIGWGQPLDARRIVLVDDLVAQSAWEQELYRMAVPPTIEVVFATVKDAGAQLAEWGASPASTIILTGDIQTMAALQQLDGRAVDRVNLGGVHHRPGRVERLPYVYLTEEELRMLERMEVAGARITAQDVPTATAVGLRALA